MFGWRPNAQTFQIYLIIFISNVHSNDVLTPGLFGCERHLTFSLEMYATHSNMFLFLRPRLNGAFGLSINIPFVAYRYHRTNHALSPGNKSVWLFTSDTIFRYFSLASNRHKMKLKQWFYLHFDFCFLFRERGSCLTNLCQIKKGFLFTICVNFESFILL